MRQLVNIQAQPIAATTTKMQPKQSYTICAVFALEIIICCCCYYYCYCVFLLFYYYRLKFIL